MKSLNLVLVSLISLTACATTSSGPIPAGENTYIMSRKEGAFPLGREPLLAETLAEARAFCEKQHRVFALVDTREAQGPFIWGNYPTATVTFSCTPQ